MSGELRLSQQGLKILKAFVEVQSENVRAEISGADVMRRAKLSSGTVYPLLLRFEEKGILQSRWERRRPQALQRPRRRLYRLTALGATRAREELTSLMPKTGLLVPSEG